MAEHIINVNGNEVGVNFDEENYPQALEDLFLLGTSKRNGFSRPYYKKRDATRRIEQVRRVIQDSQIHYAHNYLFSLVDNLLQEFSSFADLEIMPQAMGIGNLVNWQEGGNNRVFAEISSYGTLAEYWNLRRLALSNIWASIDFVTETPVAGFIITYEGDKNDLPEEVPGFEHQGIEDYISHQMIHVPLDCPGVSFVYKDEFLTRDEWAMTHNLKAMVDFHHSEGNDYAIHVWRPPKHNATYVTVLDPKLMSGYMGKQYAQEVAKLPGVKSVQMVTNEQF